MKQTTFASLAFECKKQQARRERFVAEMVAIVPWAVLLVFIESHYAMTWRIGRLPMPLAMIMRLYFMQQWYVLSDLSMALYEIESICRFASLDLTDDTMPDNTTPLKFRHLLKKPGL